MPLLLHFCVKQETSDKKISGASRDSLRRPLGLEASRAKRSPAGEDSQYWRVFCRAAARVFLVSGAMSLFACQDQGKHADYSGEVTANSQGKGQLACGCECADLACVCGSSQSNINVDAVPVNLEEGFGMLENLGNNQLDAFLEDNKNQIFGNIAKSVESKHSVAPNPQLEIAYNNRLEPLEDMLDPNHRNLQGGLPPTECYMAAAAIGYWSLNQLVNLFFHTGQFTPARASVREMASFLRVQSVRDALRNLLNQKNIAALVKLIRAVWVNKDFVKSMMSVMMRQHWSNLPVWTKVRALIVLGAYASSFAGLSVARAGEVYRAASWASTVGDLLAALRKDFSCEIQDLQN